MLYAEGSIEALRQMFADAAMTRPIERNTVVQFDQRDAFNLAAMSIAEESDLFAGRVEMNRASVARANHNIIAINQLAVTLKTIEVGYSGRVSREKNSGYMADLDSLHERCLAWADDFMPAARDEYNDLMAGETDNSDIPIMRAETMAYNATVIRILAGCYHEWTKEGEDWEPLADFLRGISLKPRSNAGSLLVEAGVVAPGGTSPAARHSLVANAIEFIVLLERMKRVNRTTQRERIQIRYRRSRRRFATIRAEQQHSWRFVMAIRISTVSNQYSLHIPAHRFRQGGRDVYYFALDLATLDGLLPERVEDAVVRGANRPLTPSHARSIQRYLDEKDDWLLGALMLGIAPDAVEFEPYTDAQGKPDNQSFGELRIYQSYEHDADIRRSASAPRHSGCSLRSVKCRW